MFSHIHGGSALIIVRRARKQRAMLVGLLAVALAWIVPNLIAGWFILATIIMGL
ncbi:MAG: hypothetical protein ACE5H5_04665 [Nitrospinota bacterium]